MKRKRRLHLGTIPLGGPPIKSRRIARKITTEYHILTKEMSIRENELDRNDNSHKKEIIQRYLEDIGGADKYQQASLINTRHHNTNKWIIRNLQRLGLKPVHNCNEKVTVLEIGAIDASLRCYPWLQVRSIDLNAQNSMIEEIDFFDISPNGEYEVLICSMVINCVPSPQKRGEMLLRMYLHLRINGLLFLILPLRCIDNKLVGKSHFQRLLECIGFELAIPIRLTPKLIFYTLRKKILLALETNNKEGVLVINDVNTSTEANQYNSIATIVNVRNSNDASGEITSDFLPYTNNWKISANSIIAQLPDDIKHHFGEKRLSSVNKKGQNEFTITIIVVSE